MKKICDICKKEINNEIDKETKEAREFLTDLIVIILTIIIAATIGLILGKLPTSEKYKMYTENRITYIERIQE